MLRVVENHSLPRTAAFFDLDKTVIAKSSTLTFSKSFYQGGLINRRAALRTAYAQFVFLAGGLDHDQMERPEVRAVTFHSICGNRSASVGVTAKSDGAVSITFGPPWRRTRSLNRRQS